MVKRDMGFLQKLGFITRMMADPDLDELYRDLKQGRLKHGAEPYSRWWQAQAAFLYAHSLEQAIQNGMKVGADPRVEPCVIFMGHGNIEIGNSFVCSFGANFRAVDEKIMIGDKVSVGPFAAVIGANHGIAAGAPIQDQPHQSAPVSIGDDVWIGANSVVLPGAVVESGAIIAAGSVVDSAVPENAIVAGVPVRPVGQRK